MTQNEFNDLRFRVELIERLVNRLADSLDEFSEQNKRHARLLREFDAEDNERRMRAAWDGRG